MKDNLQKSQESIESKTPLPLPLSKCQTALSVGQNSASQRRGPAPWPNKLAVFVIANGPRKQFKEGWIGNSVGCLISRLDSPCQCAVAFSAPFLVQGADSVCGNCSA